MRCSPTSHSGIEMHDWNAGGEGYQPGYAAQTRSSCKPYRILSFLPAVLSHIIAADRQSCRLSPNACKHPRSRSEPQVRMRPQSRPLNSHAVRRGLTRCMDRPCVARGFGVGEVGLAQMYPALCGAKLLAIMDIRAHWFSLADRPFMAIWVTRAPM